jgi:two-component system response regulator NreC
MPFCELSTFPNKFVNRNVVVILDDNSLTVREQILIDNFVFVKNIPVKKILFTTSSNKPYLNSFIYCGIEGLISSRASIEVLKEGILSVAEGQRYIHRLISEQFYSVEMEAVSVNQAKITKRELDILKCLSDGKGDKEISEELFISPKTVESHKSHLMSKFKLKTVRELAVLAASKIFNLGILFIVLISQEIPYINSGNSLID